ncbi:hypothetical protein D3C78_1433040 [compost metagenome]
MLLVSADSSALICAAVPVIVTLPVPLPDTLAPLVPAVTVSVPSPTDSVAVSTPLSASTSATDRPGFFRSSATCSVAP